MNLAKTMLNFVRQKVVGVFKKFVLVGKVLHNFLISIRIAPVPKTFVSIQMLLQGRVIISRILWMTSYQGA